MAASGLLVLGLRPPRRKLADRHSVLIVERGMGLHCGSRNAAISRSGFSMTYWQTRQARQALFSLTWRVLAFLIALLALSSCIFNGSNTPNLSDKRATAPGGTTRTPQPVDSPFKPDRKSTRLN